MTVFDLLKNWPAQTVLTGLLMVLVFLLLIPLVLRLSGLQGQQIIDVLKMTAQFAINLIEAFRAQNKDNP